MPHPKHANVDHDVLDLIRTRWSPRAFDTGRSIPRDELWRLFEAARWTPSSRNEQPWRFIVIDKVEHQPIHAAIVPTLSSGNQAWAPLAPVLIVVAVRLSFNTGPNRHAMYDAGQAVAYLTLQAQSQGLAVRQMEGFDRVRVGEICQVPGEFDLAALLAVGYPGSPDVLPSEKHRESEVAPRRRLPVTDLVYSGVWEHQQV